MEPSRGILESLFQEGVVSVPDVMHFDPDAALERVERLFWEHGTAATSIQDVANATGLNRSSLYATFGDKRHLFRAALRRYLDERALPAMRALASDGRGLAAVDAFFDGLIDVRCTGEFAGLGCMIVNAHVGPERADPEVQAMLDEHHRAIRDALHSALETARTRGDLAAGASPEATAETLALLAYAVNLRSRAGADADTLRATITAAVMPLSTR